jgi:glycerol-3-phosphate acyltransferase PlsY
VIGKGVLGMQVRSRRLPALALAAGAGYLLGSIPWADLAAHQAARGRIDLRAAGSRNPGARNVIDVLGKRWGYAVGVADIAKGAAACVVGRAVAGDLGAHVGGTAAVVGHCYPVWSRFQGGKGVACAVGQVLVTFPAAVPVEVAAGVLGAVAPAEERASAITVSLAAGWVAGALVWWRQGRPNAWGPAPTAALPVAATVSSAVVVGRFAAGRRVTPRRRASAQSPGSTGR